MNCYQLETLHTGLVMQDMQIFNHTISGNIGYGYEDDSPEAGPYTSFLCC